jgi:hypothetical protein
LAARWSALATDGRPEVDESQAEVSNRALRESTLDEQPERRIGSRALETGLNPETPPYQANNVGIEHRSSAPVSDHLNRVGDVLTHAGQAHQRLVRPGDETAVLRDQRLRERPESGRPPREAERPE